MSKLYMVIDRFDSNYRLPYVGIFDTLDEAQRLVDAINNAGPEYANLCYWETIECNTTHRSASLPKGYK